MTITCKDCVHSVFCESFGEYKCLKYSRRIYYPERLECNDYKPRFKNEAPRECQCETCLSRRGGTEE